jgi:parallel beta-helix repeat protein
MTKPQVVGVAVAAVLGLAAVPTALAKDYFVRPTGDDLGSGAAAAPWKTLQKAANTVAAGDTVTVANGTYAGFACHDKSGTPTARIIFKAETKGGAKIDSAGVGADKQDWVQLVSCSYVTVDGFEVTGAPRSGIAILGNDNTGADARDDVIQNNHSHHNGGTVSAGRHDGIFSGFALNLTVQDNEVDNNSEHGIYVSNAADNPIIRRNHSHHVGKNCIQINADLSTGGDGLISNWLIEANIAHDCAGSAGINLDGVVNGLLQNNLIYDCAAGGITLFQGDGAEASHTNLIVNNTIYNPNGSRAALQVANGANDNVVFNNILYAKAMGLEIQTVTGLVHDYNFISKVVGGSASAHEAAPDPLTLFADVVARNLGLAATSAALDSGLATLGGKSAPKVDRDGQVRPQGGGFDRGAYEGGGSGVPVTPPDGGASGTAGRMGAPDGGGAAGSTGATGAGGAGGVTGAAGSTGAPAAGGAGGVTGAAGSTGAPAAGGAGGAVGQVGDAGSAMDASPGISSPHQDGGCGCATTEGAYGWTDVALLTVSLILSVGVPIRRRRLHRPWCRKATGVRW